VTDAKRSNNITLLIILVAIMGIMAIFLPDKFLTGINFRSMIRQFPEYGLLAFAILLAMITGGIDLSVVSITSLTGVVAAKILAAHAVIGELWGVGPWTVIFLAILSALAVAVLCGILNGILITLAGVPAIIATLGTNGLFLGIAIILTEGHGITGFPTEFLFFGNGRVLGLPTQFVIFILVALLLGLILTRTAQGFRMYMLGSNPLVAKFSGVNNTMVLIKTHVLTALLAGIASIIMISSVNSMRPGYGQAYLLLAVLIAILGGTNPAGGFGTVLGVTLAIFALQAMQSGLNILSFTPFFKKFIWGLMLLLVMVIHFYRQRYAATKGLGKAPPQKPMEKAEAG